MSDTDVHTCHSECPCHSGGEPMPDFLVAPVLLNGRKVRGVVACESCALPEEVHMAGYLLIAGRDEADCERCGEPLIPMVAS